MCNVKTVTFNIFFNSIYEGKQKVKGPGCSVGILLYLMCFFQNPKVFSPLISPPLLSPVSLTHALCLCLCLSSGVVCPFEAEGN